LYLSYYYQGKKKKGSKKEKEEPKENEKVEENKTEEKKEEKENAEDIHLVGKRHCQHGRILRGGVGRCALPMRNFAPPLKSHATSPWESFNDRSK
jgi:hypothetical protein